MANRKTQLRGLCPYFPPARNQPAYSKELQTGRVRSLEGYLGGKGQQQILEQF